MIDDELYIKAYFVLRSSLVYTPYHYENKITIHYKLSHKILTGNKRGEGSLPIKGIHRCAACMRLYFGLIKYIIGVQFYGGYIILGGNLQVKVFVKILH